MGIFNECLDELGLNKDIDYDSMSYSEQERYKICVRLLRAYDIVIDASVFDKETLKKIMNYLNEKGVWYEVVNQ
jgi:cytidylate kinase